MRLVTTKKKPAENIEKMSGRVAKIDIKIRDAEAAIQALHEHLRKLKMERLELLLDPLKLGDEIMAEVPCGKTKKITKCVLEQEDGNLYIRPYKNDGMLSERHFLVGDYETIRSRRWSSCSTTT